LKKETFLKTNFKIVRRSGDELILDPCPGCGDSHHFYFNVRIGVGHCFKCGFAANIFQLQRNLKTYVPPETIRSVTKVRLPAVVRNSDLTNYLRSRFIPLERIEDYQIGLCTYGLFRDRVIIPVSDGGRFAGFVARSINGAKRKYLYPKGFKVKRFLFNYENVFPRKKIILVEGVFDVLRHPHQTLALFGKTISKTQVEKVFQKNPSCIFVCLDPDATKEAFEVCEQFFLHIPTYLVNLEEDPGDTGEPVFQEAIQHALKIDQYNLLRLRLQTCNNVYT